MHAFIQLILTWYFGILDQFGLIGVVILMAMESSVFPVPSEMVVPPAAVVYLHDAHRDAAMLNVLAVVIAGTVGSFLGSAITYWVSRWLGRPLVVKYGKYFFISERKLQHADAWMVRYGASGIFLARLLPVVRHLISIPAGIIGMRFRTFATMTVLGSFLWCSVLAVFGLIMRKDMEALIAAQVGGATSLVAQQGVERAFSNLTLATLGLVAGAMLIYFCLARRTASFTPTPVNAGAQLDAIREQDSTP
ncbi:MAG TPA: DedA family protein [Armatimonadota bacterium]